MIIDASYSYPTANIDLLLRANILPDGSARTAFLKWASIRDFDEITWDELRLVANLAGRLEVLAPQSPLRPRIDGISRHLWTRGQMLIAASASAFDLLNNYRIPFLVFKGAAFQAEQIVPNIRRVFSDVDILVRPSDVGKAFDRLTEEHWSSGTGQSVATLRRSLGRRIGVNLYSGERGEIDLHSSAFHFTKIDNAIEEELWAKAITTTLFQKPIQIPNIENAMVIMLAHSAFTGSGDWALELSARIRSQPIDWNYLAWLSQRRGLSFLVRLRLNYLREQLHISLPVEADVIFQNSNASWPELLKCYSLAARKDKHRSFSVSLSRLVTDLVLTKSSYRLEERSSKRRWAIRPRFSFWQWSSFTSKNDKTHDVFVSKTLIEFPNYSGEKYLTIDLRVPMPNMKRSMFFEVRVSDVAIALLRIKCRGQQKGRQTYQFKIKLNGTKKGPLNMEVISIANSVIKFDTPEKEKDRSIAIPFNIQSTTLSNGFVSKYFLYK